MPAPQATLSPCQRASFRSRSDKGASSKVAVSSPRCTPHGYSHERRTSSPPCALSHAACMRPVAPAPPAVVVPAPVVSPTMDIWGDAPGTTELSWISTAPSASFVMNSARLESLNVGSCASVCARARDASRANAASSSSLYAMSVRCPQALQGRPQPHLPSRRHRCTFACRRVGLSHTQSRRQFNKDASLTLPRSHHQRQPAMCARTVWVESAGSAAAHSDVAAAVGAGAATASGADAATAAVCCGCAVRAMGGRAIIVDDAMCCIMPPCMGPPMCCIIPPCMGPPIRCIIPPRCCAGTPGAPRANAPGCGGAADRPRHAASMAP